MTRAASLASKIVAIGRNYAAHAKELGNTVPKEPIIFLKPSSSFLFKSEGKIQLPPKSTEVHHEAELAVVISKTCSKLTDKSKALDYVKGYTIALDITERQLQNEARKGGEPWTLAKGYDTFCPIGDLIAKDQVQTVIDSAGGLRVWCKVNGKITQDGTTKDMVYDVPALIQYVSHVMTLYEGDIILTGTPEGVGPIRAGDKISAGIADIEEIEFDVE
eukprot:Clim_evm91s150 gene=Clim_evmTU91s150